MISSTGEDGQNSKIYVFLTTLLTLVDTLVDGENPLKISVSGIFPLLSTSNIKKNKYCYEKG